MNAAPPEDLRLGSRDLPTVAESEAKIAAEAEHARRAVERAHPGESKAEIDAGKNIERALGIERKR